MKNPFGNIEIHFPEVTFGKRKSLVNTIDSFGIRILTTMNIPVDKKHKLVYKVMD